MSAFIIPNLFVSLFILFGYRFLSVGLGKSSFFKEKVRFLDILDCNV